MLIPCSRAQVVVAEPGIRLERQTPGSMVWDEHGGTFILRVDDLAATEVPAGQSETGIILEIPLSRREELIAQPGRVRRPAGTPAVPAPGPGTAGGVRPGGLSPAGAEPVRLCRRTAPGGQKAGGDRGNCGDRPLQGPAGPLPGNRPGHPPHQGRHGPVGGLGAQPGPGRCCRATGASSWSCRWGINLRGKSQQGGGSGRLPDGSRLLVRGGDNLYY